MSHYILASEVLFLAGAGFRFLYFRRQSSKSKEISALFPSRDEQKLLELQSIYGYSEHSLVSISGKRESWFDNLTDSALNYSEDGKVWLVAGETLAANENLVPATARFLTAARKHGKIVAFMPATEKFAQIITDSTTLKAVKIGAAPCFDLENWNPRGNKSKHLRAGLSQARRSKICIVEVFEISENLRREVADLCERWLETRRSMIKFGWLFELLPFQNQEKKKFFTARNETGELVGFLAASPIPARQGWYLEDVLRSPDAPNGTADLLVYETLKLLASQGAKFATLGTAPLAKDGEDTLSTDGNFITKQLMKFSAKYLNGFYNFEGIRNFKAKFVPSRWESQYVLVSKGMFNPPFILKAFLRTIIREK